MDSVKLEQIRILQRLSPPTYVLSICVGATLSFVFADLVGTRFVGAWFFVLIVITLLRYLCGRYILMNEPKKSVQTWALFQCLGTFVAGCTWSALVLQLDASWPALYQMILVASLTGIIAGAISSNSSYFLALASFYTPMLMSVMWVSTQQDDPRYLWMIPLTSLFWAIVHITGRRFAGILASNIRMQHSLAVANEQLELVARLDSLTQLQNRSALESYLSATWEEYQLVQRPVSIAMIDVDMFKAYNDFYGHLQGDKCLMQVAKVLRSVVPEPLGFVGRYGGEEFIVVLPGYSKSEALKLLQKAMDALKAERIEHDQSTISQYLTASVGLESAVPVVDEDWMELIDRADAKLYIAKQRGRNQIV